MKPLLAALVLLAACASTPTSIDGLYEAYLRDLSRRGESRVPNEAERERQVARAQRARALAEGQALESARDLFRAAVILVESDDEADLELSHTLALAAAERGEDRGLRVAAEAMDKGLVRAGMHQRYGTQYVWEPVLRAWRLYPVDPRTTDAERAVMGVEPMERLLARETELNELTAAERN